ncbi:TIGR03773 family transporter-associated surface protein [Actinoplanes couchii]|uniref:LPXTG-motif cell wall anchor domain protein n=1 Tax=Actinoplanes couchii TaxID=403638 RepID=A0ABQ3XEQ9_9ACTN|nr:TIGR03773 family transporter-associated surface protein [Actinoplanes couchii]MDR6319841.1 surface-anchored protein/LPXTG-motif cell wall-anchored protein [Actinoplanes couchii]GID56975.1 hypothetical protein Aco03nite_053790 [Actinoplanes couchii]
MRKTAAAVTASLAVVLGTGTPASAAPQADGSDLVALTVESGELRMSFRSESGSDTDPRSLAFTASGSPAGTIPDDPEFAFLGKAGAPVWSLQEGSPFSTFDTTAISKGEVTLELASVEGPGSFAAYTLSEWGRPTLLFDSDGPRSTNLPAGQRLGGVVWMFDAVGEYRVTLRATSGKLTDEAVYSISVQTKAQATPQQAAPQKAAVPKAGAVAAASTAAAGQKVISDGHVDMGPNLSGGTMTIRLKDDTTTPPTWRELSAVTLKVTSKAQIDVPAGAGYAFLGKAGDKVYLLPQSQQSGIVWPGWNTQHESVVSGTKGNVTWRLKQVTGPGAFKLFLTGSFGTPEVIFDSANSLPQQLSIAPNTHAHGNWAFTKAGIYRLAVEMTATTTAGKSVSDTKALTFAVGDSTDTGSSADKGGNTGTDKGGNDAGNKDTSGNDKANSGGGGLAKTGTDVMSIAVGGVLLLGVGTAVVVLSRRRKSTPDPS